jgi:hypothetical protein
MSRARTTVRQMRRRPPVCASINSIGLAFKKQIEQHVKKCTKCQKLALERQINRAVEAAVFGACLD